MTPGGYLAVQRPGLLSNMWTSNAGGTANINATFHLQDDGNLTVINPSGQVAWASNTGGH
jgi:hypothetical protein